MSKYLAVLTYDDGDGHPQVYAIGTERAYPIPVILWMFSQSDYPDAPSPKAHFAEVVNGYTVHDLFYYDLAELASRPPEDPGELPDFVTKLIKEPKEWMQIEWDLATKQSLA